MANRRRADSADPAGAGANRDRDVKSGSGRGRLRNLRASVSDVVEIDQAASLANDVEQIAMLARGGVGPLAGRAPAGFAPFQPDEHGSAGGVLDIPDQPVAAGTSAIRKIISAHRLGLARETERQFTGLPGVVTQSAPVKPRPFGTDARRRRCLTIAGVTK